MFRVEAGLYTRSGKRVLEAYLGVREVLELMALDLAQDSIKKVEVEAILEGEHHALNNAMHHYIIEKSENRYVRDFFSQYVARYYTKLFYYAAPETSVVDEMTAQHKCILESLISRDWNTAKKLLSEHIRAQKSVLRKLLVNGENTAR